jgi:hypothetical protein
MKKIQTLFRRDPDDRRFVTREVEPGCEWVLAGEGVATRKYDGTCVRFDGADWWTRREVKEGKTVPDGFVAEQHDEVTGKTVGWEPAGQSAFAKYLNEALTHHKQHGAVFPPATYELIGPKINGNPEKALLHCLVTHGADTLDAPRTYDDLAEWLHANDYEGIVWHHPDGRMVKIKRRDLPSAKGS